MPWFSRSHKRDTAAGLKRWVVLLILGAMLWGLCLATAFAPQQPLPTFIYLITLQFFDQVTRALLMVVSGALFVAIALYQLNRRCRPTAPIASPAANREPATPVAREPAVVVLGGGHGLSTLLHGLKPHTTRLTAIVTVADDGGSSGALRRGTGMLPPGDLRRCIAALSEAEPLITQLFEYRFGQGAGLDGHAFGNLFIAALAQITGDFVSGVSAASRVLAVHGRIVPSSLDNIELWAEVETPSGPTLLQGQSRISQAPGRLERVYIRPETAKGYPEAIRALLEADMIVMGPGSLYTSILPNLLVGDIRDAIRVAPALKVFVCNVATQPGETDGYDVRDHVAALEEHLGQGFCDCVLANATTDLSLPNASSRMVQLGQGELTCQLVLDDLVDRQQPWRHDASRLGDALMALCHERLCAGPTNDEPVHCETRDSDAMRWQRLPAPPPERDTEYTDHVLH